MSRVFYMSCMTVISQMRTNLPRIHSKVWPNGNGNLGHSGGNKWIGVGGSRSWWWDEALTSMMLALLEPSGRAPTFQFWLGHDDHPGRSKRTPVRLSACPPVRLSTIWIWIWIWIWICSRGD